MVYEVSLGGKTFALPSLPWGLVVEIQPGLLGWAAKFDFARDGATRITTADLKELGDLVYKAVARSPEGKTMTAEDFADLPIATLDMAKAVQPILQACGLKLAAPGEGGADPKA